MAGNSTCPTNITSIDDVIKLVANLPLIDTNTTNEIDLQATYGALLQQCPDICSAITGTGNPDLTGIGLFVHYCIQAALTVIFGNWIHLFGATLSRKAPRSFSVLVELQATFIDFNAYAVFIITVTALVKTCQHPSMFETIILPILVEFETWMLMLNLISSASHHTPSSQSAGHKPILYACFLAFAAACNYFIQSRAEGVGKIQDLTEYCWADTPVMADIEGADFLTQLYGSDNYQIFPPIFATIWLLVQSWTWLTTALSKIVARTDLHLPCLRVQESFATTKRAWPFIHYFSALLLILCFLSPMFYAIEAEDGTVVIVSFGDQLFWAVVSLYPATAIFGYILGRCLRLRPVNGQSVVRTRKLRRSSFMPAVWRSVRCLKRASPALWLIPSAFFFIVNPILHLRNMQYYRNIMKTDLGPLFADDQWGIGQVAAILTWMPLLTVIITATHALCFPKAESNDIKLTLDDNTLKCEP